MNKNIKIATWIAALAISIATIVPSQAQDRSYRYNDQRYNQEIIYMNHQRPMVMPGWYGQQARFAPPRGRQYGKMNKRQKMKNIRRLRRLYSSYRYPDYRISNYRYERPMIYISPQIIIR